jgi:hypothetical protein
MSDLLNILIIIIPLALISVFLDKKRKENNIKRVEYGDFLSQKQYIPPQHIHPFLASYVLTNFITYNGMMSILYSLLEKDILSVVKMEEKEYGSDFVFVFKKELKETKKIAKKLGKI